MSQKACVYDIVHKGEVVYVGMTNNPKKRLHSHKSSGIAQNGAELFVHKWYETRKEAKIAEAMRQDELEPILCKDRSIHHKIHRKMIIESLSYVFLDATDEKLERWAQIWCDPLFVEDKEAYEAMPEEVRQQIKSMETARRVFGRRKPNNGNIGRPKKKVNGQLELPNAIYDIITDGQIVYTGVSCKPYNRFQAHLQTGVANRDSYMEIIEWYQDRAEAFAAETLRINVLLPPLNTMQVRAKQHITHANYGAY